MKKISQYNLDLLEEVLYEKLFEEKGIRYFKEIDSNGIISFTLSIPFEKDKRKAMTKALEAIQLIEKINREEYILDETLEDYDTENFERDKERLKKTL